MLRLLRIPAFLGAVALTAPVGDALMAAGTHEPPASTVASPSAPACPAEAPALVEEAGEGLASRPRARLPAPVGIPRWLADLQPIDLPIARPEAVEEALRWLVTTERGRKFVFATMFRSGRHVAEIARALHDRQLPRALVAVPFLESGYAENAASKAGAVGLWQLMPATARDYGLAVTKTYDQRRGAAPSTQAAIEHLSRLHAATGSWELSLAAYDLGLGRLRRNMERYGVDDYWALRGIDGALPDETRKYVPMVLACALLLENLEAFGFAGIARDRPVPTSDLDVPVGTHLAVVARAAGTSLRSLLSLNPEILHGKRMPDAATILHVPAEGLTRAQTMLPALLDAKDPWTTAVPPDFDWGADLDPRSWVGAKKPSAHHVDLLAAVKPAAPKPKPTEKKPLPKRKPGHETVKPLVVLLGSVALRGPSVSKSTPGAKAPQATKSTKAREKARSRVKPS